MSFPGTIIILAAGQGTRMRSKGPKVLQSLCGRPMLGYVLDQARALDPERIIVVVGHAGDEVRAWVKQAGEGDRVSFVTQEEQNGTGHAVAVCSDELRGGAGPVMVLYGDMPLLTAGTLQALADARGEAKASLLTNITSKPRGFGRILRDAQGFIGIVEEKDATGEQRLIQEVNVGVYCFEREALLSSLPKLSSENAQGEFYLTDILGMQTDAGERVELVTLEDESETIGINSLEHLAEARAQLQYRILGEHMERGVYIEDPASCYIDHGVEIGAGTRILPCSVIRGGVVVGEDCEVGPFTHLRVGTVLKDGAEVGNFTESKKSTIGEGTKAKHLSYLGDVTIGAGANIGAGTIVANYDGTNKHKTSIGDRAFIGSGSILIAPMSVGDDALTGAGAVVKKNTNIKAGESWVGLPARAIKRNPSTD